MSSHITVVPEFSIRRIDRCAVAVSPLANVSVTADHALAILEQSFELTEHRQYVVLVDVRMVDDVSPEARRIFMAARHVLAAAMLGRGPMDRMLSAPYEGAVYPSEFFTDQGAAMKWLNLIHDLVCEDPIEHTMSLTVDLDPFATRPGAERTV
ncbi:hypothetical protein [Arthrobacter sp. NPDC092385]|uniref:DUF7793 family protein n=1 Tax=Arthrobacter sp. NPDC092385 TaxID=3363943 RepID=UPI003817FAB0